MTYSYDLRRKALDYLEKSGCKTKTSEIFGVTKRTLLNWINRQQKDCLAAKKREQSPSKIDVNKLRLYIEKNPEAYLREIAKEMGVTLTAIFYACKRLKITLKKRPYSTKSAMKKSEKPLIKL